MSNLAVGFYWTLPVNWADFRRLPDDVETAAAKTKTIRYQAESVRRWAKENAYQLTHEVVYLDTRTDRATEGCKAALDKIRQKCAVQRTALIYVDFGYTRFWRPNHHLREHAEALGFEGIGIPPEPVAIDGILFDPIKHFEDWRALDKSVKADLRRTADEELFAANLRFPSGSRRYACIADWLNERGVKTTTGKIWTDETVRKTIKNKIESTSS